LISPCLPFCVDPGASRVISLSVPHTRPSMSPASHLPTTSRIAGPAGPGAQPRVSYPPSGCGARRGRRRRGSGCSCGGIAESFELAMGSSSSAPCSPPLLSKRRGREPPKKRRKKGIDSRQASGFPRERHFGGWGRTVNRLGFAVRARFGMSPFSGREKTAREEPTSSAQLRVT
jgi:hypothetical protein